MVTSLVPRAAALSKIQTPPDLVRGATVPENERRGGSGASRSRGVFPVAIILHVARGWESKSVEQQQDEAASASRKVHPILTSEELARQGEKQGLMLSRRRIVQQLEAARSPRHREMLQAALLDLDAKLSRLG